MAEVRVTKMDKYEVIRTIVEGSGHADEDMLLEFIDGEMKILENRAAKAKERQANRRAEGDELRAKVLGFITDEFQTADQITAQFEDEDITVAKVRARLNQLVDLEEIEKDYIKDGSRKVMGYRIKR